MTTRRLIALVLATAIGSLTGVAMAGSPVVQRVVALEAAVAALQTTVTALQTENAMQQVVINELLQNVDMLRSTVSTVSTLPGQLAMINASPVMALNPYLTVTTGATPRALFTGLNVQLVNGVEYEAGDPQTPNGLGNLIIGYDHPTTSRVPYCSDGQYPDEFTCVSNGGTFATSHKTGSHYLVVGDENNYSQYGGLVVGYWNTSNAPYASVSGGNKNTASAPYASVSGGSGNTASGWAASASGGFKNTASETTSSVSGGSGNTASGLASSVSGGSGNTASGQYASVSGGSSNQARGQDASVSGGIHRYSDGIDDWSAGALFEDY